MDPPKNLPRGHFNLLPDQVILEIFSYLDLNSLRRSVSISKLFSRLVPLTPSVSLSLPKPCVPSRRDTLTDLFRDLLFSISSSPRSTTADQLDEDEHVGVIILSGPKRIVPMRLEDNVKYSLILEKLKGFTMIQTLHIDLIDDDDDDIDDAELDFHRLDFTSPDQSGRFLDGVIKWKATFGSAGIESCFILGTACLERIGSERSSEALFPLTKDNKQQHMILSWASYCLEAAWVMQAMLKDVIGCYPTVEDAVVRDTAPKGKVVFRKGSIMNGLIEQKLEMKLWYVAELELPRSGYVVKGATFIAIKPNHHDDDDAGCLLEEAFCNDDDDDGEYGVRLSEFVTEMRMPMESSSVRLARVFNFPYCVFQ